MQTYTQIEFGKVLAVTKVMWMFGIKKRDLTDIVQSLQSTVRRKREQLCADRLDQSYETTYTVNDVSGNYTAQIAGGNSVALISSAQTREDGGANWNNRITDGTTVNMTFDYDAIKAVHRTTSLIKDGKGNDMDINADTFIFKKGTANFFRAQEILGAINAGGKQSIPGSADNDANGVPAYDIIALPWIKSNTAFWWAFDSSMRNLRHGLQYKEAQPMRLEGPNVVLTIKHLLQVTVVEQFRKFRETLRETIETILSEVLYNFAFTGEI